MRQFDSVCLVSVEPVRQSVAAEDLLMCQNASQNA